MPSFAWHDAAGLAGVSLIVLSYLALQLGRLDGQSLAHAGANAVGAALVLVSLAFEFNLSAFVVEAFWLAISLLGVARIARTRGGGRRMRDGRSDR